MIYAHVRGVECDVGVMEALSDTGRGARARWFNISPLCVQGLFDLVDSTAESRSCPACRRDLEQQVGHFGENIFSTTCSRDEKAEAHFVARVHHAGSERTRTHTGSSHTCGFECANSPLSAPLASQQCTTLTYVRRKDLSCAAESVDRLVPTQTGRLALRYP